MWLDMVVNAGGSDRVDVSGVPICTCCRETMVCKYGTRGSSGLPCVETCTGWFDVRSVKLCRGGVVDGMRRRHSHMPAREQIEFYIGLCCLSLCL